MPLSYAAKLKRLESLVLAYLLAQSRFDDALAAALDAFVQNALVVYDLDGLLAPQELLCAIKLNHYVPHLDSYLTKPTIDKLSQTTPPMSPLQSTFASGTSPDSLP